MLKKLSEKLGTKFPGSSIVKTARLFFNQKQAQWKVNCCSKKKEKEKKER